MYLWSLRWAMWWAASTAVLAIPPLEKAHQLWWLTSTTPSPYVNVEDRIPDPFINSPDFRIDEPLWTAWTLYRRERNRPYRISPHRMTGLYYPRDHAYRMGCTCCTVYKRLTPLSACAVLTSRHMLTTASSVELVLRGHRNLRSLENILGVWYDHNINSPNSTFYMSVSRIHYHPEFLRPENVNRSHPLPNVFDLAVLATIHNVYGYYLWPSNTIICDRASGSWHEQSTPMPTVTDVHKNILNSVGFQFIWSLNRFPTPFHKYFVRSHEYGSCPKKEWGWHVCIDGFAWAKYGMDSGSTLFRTADSTDYRHGGLLGMLSVSMRLRDDHISLYYLILDCHKVIDFLYDAFMGRFPYEYLDYRFEDTLWGAPEPKPWAWIHHNFELGEQWHYDYQWW